MRTDREHCALVLASTIKNVDPSDPFFQCLVDDALAIAPEIVKGVPRMLARARLAPRLRELSHPVLVVHGAEDPILPKAEAKRLASLLPNGRYKEVPDRGHSLNVEDPEQFAELLRHFLA